MSMTVAPAGVAPLTSAQATFAPLPAAAPAGDLQAAIQALAVAVQALTDALAGSGMLSATPTIAGSAAAPIAAPTTSSTPGVLDAITGATDIAGASGGVPVSGGGGGSGGGCGCGQASAGAGALGAPAAQGALGAPKAKKGKGKSKGKGHAGHGGAGGGAVQSPVPTQGVSPYLGASGGKLVHPLPGARLSSHYGENSSIRSGSHDGTDFAKASGSPIFAAAAGKVVEVKYDGDGYGNYVTIDHGNGYRTRYAHMLSKSPLAVGATVQAGETIGKVGSTGNSTGPHLHFMVMQNGKAVNAEPYLSGAKSF